MDDFDRLYRERIAQGQMGWHAGGYDDFELRPFLEEMLSQYPSDPRASRLLDLGCGCGETSCFLASRGFVVTAIDISPTAIAAAQQAAAQRGVPVDFRVADVRREAVPGGPYDVILDGQLLHCIVDLADRADLLARIRAALAPGGELWSDTMAGRPQVSEGEGWRLDDEGVFWKIQPEGPWQPVRRIQPSLNLFSTELQAGGFELLWHDVLAPVEPTDVEMLRSRWKGAAK